MGLLIAVLLAAAPDVEAGLREIHEGLKEARPIWSLASLDALPEVWGKPVKPGSPEFRAELLARYGLAYDDGFPNDGLPMGLTRTKAPMLAKASKVPGMTVSCQLCHAAPLMGGVTDGVGNVFMDFQRLHEDLHRAGGTRPGSFYVRNPPRNSMVNTADYSGRLALFVRPRYPAIDLYRLYMVFASEPSEHDELRELHRLKAELPLAAPVKTQPWAGYRYKTSGTNVDRGYTGNPADVHYALNFTNDERGRDLVAARERFGAVGPAYLRSVTAPAYPWRAALDRGEVARGHATYQRRCASCHGDFVEREGDTFELQRWPAKLVDRKVLGTDTLRIDYPINIAPEIPGSFLEGVIVPTFRYVAPPLVGIWARAPYLHNASVPTLRQLLNPGTRFRRYGLSPRPNDPASYDRHDVGWKVIDLSALDAEQLAVLKRDDLHLRIYDPDEQPGLSNTGHTFGDDLPTPEQDALLAFLTAL